MIVRIMTDNQYRLADERLPELQRLDDALENAMDRADDEGFHSALIQLIAFVHAQGSVVDIEEVVPSDLIVPAPDMSLAEAKSRIHPSPVQTSTNE